MDKVDVVLEFWKALLPTGGLAAALFGVPLQTWVGILSLIVLSVQLYTLLRNLRKK